MFSKFAEEEKEDAQRYYERGEYYEKQGDDAQALSNYLNSFRAYARYIDYDEASYKGRIMNEYLAGERAHSGGEISYKDKDKINFIFDLCNRLSAIGKYYAEAYIAAKQKEIFDILSKYQQNFDVKQIELYQSLSDLVRVTSNIVENNQEYLEKIKKIDPEKEPDETLKEIRLALLKISGTKICLATLEAKPEKSGCFIATAAYSTSIHPDLDTFRSFRDQKLLTNSVGKQLVSFYYTISPNIAHYLEQQTEIKGFVKQQLGYLARWMRRKGITRI
jgi:tetratricopeptide (TPR) repeat protein